MKITKICAFFVFIVLLVMSVSAVPCSETMTRTSSKTTVSPGESFTLTYTAVGTSSSTWGGTIIEDNAAGGCTFPSGTGEYRSVMLSDGGTTKTISVTAPTSGSCTFTGSYQFGKIPGDIQCDINSFSTTTITVSGSCTPDCSCASNTCSGQTCSNGCGGTCPGTKTTNCGGDTCSETMTRTISGNSVTYTAVGTSGAWGASIVDSVTGGCAFPSGSTTLNEVMLSTDGATKTIQLTGTLSSCTFTGDYKFGTCAVKQFGSTPTECNPSQSYSCTDSSGCAGTKICNSAGNGYGSCIKTNSSCGVTLCGNGVCDTGETATSCSADCAALTMCKDSSGKDVTKEFYQDVASDGTCTISTWVWIVGGFFGLILMISLLKK